jgi:hypothetical protein
MAEGSNFSADRFIRCTTRFRRFQPRLRTHGRDGRSDPSGELSHPGQSSPTSVGDHTVCRMPASLERGDQLTTVGAFDRLRRSLGDVDLGSRSVRRSVQGGRRLVFSGTIDENRINTSQTHRTEKSDSYSSPVGLTRALPKQVYGLHLNFPQRAGASRSDVPYIRVKTAIAS